MIQIKQKDNVVNNFNYSVQEILDNKEDITNIHYKSDHEMFSMMVMWTKNKIQHAESSNMDQEETYFRQRIDEIKSMCKDADTKKVFYIHESP